MSWFRRPAASVTNYRVPVTCRDWTREQIETAKKGGKVAVLYASAYGNTAGMAQAISHGITKAGIAVETLNLEVDSVDDALKAVKESKGFIIGSPTLGGHLPTQASVQSMTAAMLCCAVLSKQKPCSCYSNQGPSLQVNAS